MNKTDFFSFNPTFTRRILMTFGLLALSSIYLLLPIKKSAAAVSTDYAFSTRVNGSLALDRNGNSVDLSDQPSLLSTWVEDATTGERNIGFDFWFMGTRYVKYTATSDGYIALGFIPSDITIDNAFNYFAPVIAPFWDDIKANGTSPTLRAKTIGTAPNRALVIEWQVCITSTSFSLDGIFQLRLYETTGIIEFVYGTMNIGDGLVTASIGFSNGSTDGSFLAVSSLSPYAVTSIAAQEPATRNLVNSNVKGPISGLNSTADGSRIVFTFIPAAPSAPTGLSYTSVTQSGMTLNWTDTANGEDGCVIYRSDDGGASYQFKSQVAANATSAVQTGLLPGTTYYWRIYAVSEGALSSALQGSRATNAPGSITTGGSGNWSSTTPNAPWPGGVVPTATDNVVIANGHTVTINTAAACNNLTVGQGASGILQFETTTARTLTVNQSLTIAIGGTFRSATSGTQKNHSATVAGDLTVTGTLDFSTNNNTAGANLTFLGTLPATFTVTGTCDFGQSVNLNKGSDTSYVVTFIPGGTITTLGVVGGGFLTLSNGTFKISGTNSFSNPVMRMAGYAIPSTGGLWLNNPNATITGQASGSSSSGLIRITAGTYNIGTTSSHGLICFTPANVIIEGGSLVAAAYLHVFGDTYSQTGGTVSVSSAGNTTANMSFQISGTATNMAGGTIVLVQRQSGSALYDYWVDGAGSFTGTTLQIGSASTATNFDFKTVGKHPKVAIDNSGNPKQWIISSSNQAYGNVTVNTGTTLNLGANTLQLYANLTNNGTLQSTTGTLEMAGAAAQSIGGSAAFSVSNLSINNLAGVSLGVDVTASSSLLLTSGDLSTGSKKLTLSNGATVGPSNSSYDVVGSVKRSGMSTGTRYSFNHYNTSLEFTSGTVPTDITVDLVKSAPADFNNAIARTYTITPAGGSGYAATLRLHYLDSDLNGNAEANLDLWRLDGTTWTSLSKSANDTANNWVEKSGVTDFSSWTLSESSPTDVTLVEFRATTYSGGVALQWRTGYEIDNLGFNLYRDETGTRVRINKQVIAGSALLVSANTALHAGRSYQWNDNFDAGRFASQYWLEDVDLKGHSTFHGPFSAAPGNLAEPPIQSLTFAAAKQAAASAQRQIVETEIAADRPNTADSSATITKPSSDTATILSTQWEIARQDAVKILIRKDGWYRVTQPQLVAAGFNTSNPPRLLSLFVEGAEVAIKVNGEEDGKLDPIDCIEFYATAIDSPATDTRVYWLVSNNVPGRRIVKAGGFDAAPTAARSFPLTTEVKPRSTFFSSLKNQETENWFGPVVTSEPVEQILTLDSVDQTDTQGAVLEIALQGVTYIPDINPDHAVDVSINGQLLGTLLFDGQARNIGRFELPTSTLREGENVVTIKAQDSGVDVTLIDYISLTYAHTYLATNNSLLCTIAGQEMVTVGGFNTDRLRAYDLTDKNNVKELTGTIEPESDTFNVRVASRETGRRVILALSDDSALSPAGVIANHRSSWNEADQRADIVMISHSDFLPSLKLLTSLRESQGYIVAVVDIEDLYDEFNFGSASPQAVRDFLSRARGVWKKAPKYVLLVGDSTFDPKNYLGLEERDYVPTGHIDTMWMEAVSDDWFVDSNLDGIPELAIGRLPARTVQEVQTMVSKIINYEKEDKNDRGQAEKWALLVADKNEGFNFEGASASLKNIFPKGMPVREIRRGSLDDESARTQVISALNQGPSIVNYFGHGSVDIWNGDLLNTTDAAGLDNRDKLSLFVSMTCLNGMFPYFYGDSLAESLMKAKAGGAIAVWASSSVTVPNAQVVMGREVIKNMLGGGGARGKAPILGEAVIEAKTFVTDKDVRSSWILFGDPLLRVH